MGHRILTSVFYGRQTETHVRFKKHNFGFNNYGSPSRAAVGVKAIPAPPFAILAIQHPCVFFWAESAASLAMRNHVPHNSSVAVGEANACHWNHIRCF